MRNIKKVAFKIHLGKKVTPWKDFLEHDLHFLNLLVTITLHALILLCFICCSVGNHHKSTNLLLTEAKLEVRVLIMLRSFLHLWHFEKFLRGFSV